MPIGAIASWALFSLGWFKGVLGGWQTVALNAMAISLLHEMVRQAGTDRQGGRGGLVMTPWWSWRGGGGGCNQEHDLIHDLYFKRLPRVQDLMFAFIWALKGSASPW